MAVSSLCPPSFPLCLEKCCVFYSGGSGFFWPLVGAAAPRLLIPVGEHAALLRLCTSGLWVNVAYAGIRNSFQKYGDTAVAPKTWRLSALSALPSSECGHIKGPAPTGLSPPCWHLSLIFSPTLQMDQLDTQLCHLLKWITDFPFLMLIKMKKKLLSLIWKAMKIIV